MKPVIGEIALSAQGNNRDDGLAFLDNLSLEIMDLVGGTPWVKVDDDVQRMLQAGHASVDEQGFLYVFKRRYMFQGPVREGFGPIQFGHEVQKAIRDENV